MKRSMLLVVIAALLLAGCGAARLAATQPARSDLGYTEPQAGYGGAPVEMPGVVPASDALKSTTENYQANAPASGTGVQDRLVIQNVNLSIVVEDVNARARAIQDMAKQMGGFVVSVNIYQTYSNNGIAVPQAEVVVRVPAEKLDDALAQVKKDIVGEPQNETRSGQDVTDQYVDLQSRLKAKQIAEDQLTKIMQEATKTEDVLAVYQQLQQVESDIEVLKGQISYYEQAAALSAISVSIVAEASVQPIEVGGWKPQGDVRNALQDLVYFFQNFVTFLIWFVLNFLVKLLTYAVVLGLPLWLIFRGVRKSWQKRKAAQTPPPAA